MKRVAVNGFGPSFEGRDQAHAHLDAGARTVMISAVAADAD